MNDDDVEDESVLFCGDWFVTVIFVSNDQKSN